MVTDAVPCIAEILEIVLGVLHCLLVNRCAVPRESRILWTDLYFFPLRSSTAHLDTPVQVKDPRNGLTASASSDSTTPLLLTLAHGP